MKCASCGDQWKDRKLTSYGTGVQSTPYVSGMQILSKFGSKRIQLYFCDIHGNVRLRHITRYNKTGTLQIRNVITNKWRNAEKIGTIQ